MDRLSLPLFMSTFKKVLTEVAGSDVPVLLLGEFGVGKHLVARQIHEASPLSGMPFVQCDCRDTDEATIRRLFDVDENGNRVPSTLYLKSVETLPSAAQRALLACIEAGEHQPRWPRVIASGSTELELEVRTGRFREDLYYKLSGICVPIPPLRYRKEDIDALSEQYLAKYAKEFSRPKPDLTPQLVRFLHAHPWMGNLRELEDAMRTIVAVGNVRIAIAALQSPMAASVRDRKNGSEAVSLKQVGRAACQRAERDLILKVLSRTHWNRKKAAEELRISYKALLYKLKEISSSHAAVAAQGAKSE